MDKIVLGKSHFLVFLIFCASPCWAESKGDSREPVNVNARFAQLGFVERTYADSIPGKMQTTITPGAGDSKADGVDLVIDSTGGKEIFPIERHPREFGDEKQLSEFMQKTFLSDKNSDRTSGTYLRMGDSYFYDPKPGIAYRVDDPILAYAGGATGVVLVGGKSYCIDPDGKCDSDIASYLVPVGQPTAPTNLDVCGTILEGTPVCVHHHAFYNWTWFLGTYVRHGTNVRFTTWAALPSSQIRLRFDLEGSSTSRVTRIGAPVIGQDFAEIAIFCWFDCSHDVVNAQSICADNRVIDPDLSNRLVTTGNGPANLPTSTFCTTFT